MEKSKHLFLFRSFYKNGRINYQYSHFSSVFFLATWPLTSISFGIRLICCIIFSSSKLKLFNSFTCLHFTTIHRSPNFRTRYSVMCKVYTGYCGTSKIEHGLCACTVDNPLAKARGLSPPYRRTNHALSPICFRLRQYQFHNDVKVSVQIKRKYFSKCTEFI